MSTCSPAVLSLFFHQHLDVFFASNWQCHTVSDSRSSISSLWWWLSLVACHSDTWTNLASAAILASISHHLISLSSTSDGSTMFSCLVARVTYQLSVSLHRCWIDHRWSISIRNNNASSVWLESLRVTLVLTSIISLMIVPLVHHMLVWNISSSVKKVTTLQVLWWVERDSWIWCNLPTLRSHMSIWQVILLLIMGCLLLHLLYLCFFLLVWKLVKEADFVLLLVCWIVLRWIHFLLFHWLRLNSQDWTMMLQNLRLVELLSYLSMVSLPFGKFLVFFQALIWWRMSRIFDNLVIVVHVYSLGLR